MCANRQKFDDEPLEKLDKFGCKHYRRRVQVRCEDCNNFFTCQHCHDEQFYYNRLFTGNEKEPKHKMNPKISKIRCLNCFAVQKPSEACSNCEIVFSPYFCKKCVFYNDKYEKTRTFHCDDCNSCVDNDGEKFKNEDGKVMFRVTSKH